MRQDADGTWSHKLCNGGPVTNLDADGNVIWSPAANLYYCTYAPEQNAYIHLNYQYVGTYLVGPAN